MSSSFLLHPGVDLIDEAVAHIRLDGGDCSSNLVIFPGRRPAHFLRKQLARKIGRGYIPPRIFSIDDVVDMIYYDILRRTETDLDDIDAVALLYDIHAASPQRIGGDNFLSVDEFLPVGMRVFREIEELKMACLSLRRVRELGGLHLPFKGADSLSRFYEEFYDAAAARGCSTRSMRYASVAADVQVEAFAGFSSIIVAGFFALTAAEQQLFRKLASIDQAVFLFQDGPGIEKPIAQLQLKPEHKVVAGPETVFNFIAAPDVHGEVFALTAQAAALKDDGRADDRTVFVVPDSNSLFPVLHETLSLLDDEEFNISLGYPLERTPAFAFLNAIMEAVTSMFRGTFYAPEYFKLVLHPYTKNIRCGRSAEITRIMFHGIEDEFAGKLSKAFFTLDEVEASGVFETLPERLSDFSEPMETEELRAHLRQIHDNLLRPFLEIANLGDFCRKCIAVLEYIHGESTANRHIYFQPFVETLAERLQAIARSMLGSRTFAEPINYVNFVRRCISASRIPFEGTPLHGIQVLGFLETRNIAFDRVFLLDANDDVLPGARGVEMLLPQQVREHLGLETYRDREALTAYYFHLLVRNAREVNFLFLQGNGKEKSRYVEKILWERQRADSTYHATPYVHVVQYKVALGNKPPAAVPKTPAAIARCCAYAYNPTALDTYLKCPLKFYHGRVLRLAEREEAARAPEQKDVGTLVHHALAEYFEPLQRKVLAETMFDHDALDRIIDRLFTEECGDEPAGTKFLLKRQIKIQLWKFIESYQIPLLRREKVIIATLEQAFGAERKGRAFRGYADRIERRGDRHFILDYKTGANESYYRIRLERLNLDDRATWSDAIGSIQLPLYALMYSKAYDVPLSMIEPAYIMLGRNVLNEECEVRVFKDDAEGTVEERYELLGNVIDGLVDEILNPDVPFHPTTDMEGNCPKCEFKYMCGTQFY